LSDSVSRGTILIVDDEALIRELIMVRLSKRGFTVVEASNGIEGYEKMKATSPDLIICDVMMPQEDGITFCRKLRSQGDMIPFIFLTANDRSHNVVVGLESGADEYLIKPFDMNELEARILALLRRTKKPL
jgi:two-component system response regulator MprA